MVIIFSQDIYFRNFENIIQNSFDNISWNDTLSYPIILKYEGIDTSGNVYFMNNLIITNNNQYFTIGSNNININGFNNDVFIQNVIDYNGLFQNGDDLANGYSNIKIKNISVKNDNSNISDNGGWLCQQFFGKSSTNVILDNLRSDGEIPFESGGICGAYCAVSHGHVTITNCHTTGNMIDDFAGGICGDIIASEGGEVVIINCSSSGDIYGKGSGGICGSNIGLYNGSTIIEKCHSSGEIQGFCAGGIAGAWFGEITTKECQILNCYTTGNITGNSAGGIVGGEIAIDSSGSVLIQNCYTIGNVSSNSGSICGGKIFQNYSSAFTIKNCYTLEQPLTSNTLPNGVSVIVTDTSYGVSQWNSPSASNYLLGAPTYQNDEWISDGAKWLAPNPKNNLTLPFIFEKNTILKKFYIPQSHVVGQLTEIIPPETNRDGLFTYSSSNTSIAQIIENKYVHFVNVGFVNIIATQQNIDGWNEGVILYPIKVTMTQENSPANVISFKHLFHSFNTELCEYIFIQNTLTNVHLLKNETLKRKIILSNGSKITK